jgi:hypothetical protein
VSRDRTPVPLEISSQVLFLHDHTCCVCRERGKGVQLHHIDGNPTNHSDENLAVLCFEDHERTQTRGGFGKKLLPPEVVQYRNDWLARVTKRREEADRLAAASMGGPPPAVRQEGPNWIAPPNTQLIAYINHLPALRKAAYESARDGWAGTTASMKSATAEVVDILERVLGYLSAWYTPNHFGPDGAEKYFSDYIASRYQWHRSLHEPQGPGSGGTIAGVLAGGGAMEDVARAVEDIVEALAIGEINLVEWRKQWRAAEKKPPERWGLWGSIIAKWLTKNKHDPY